MKPRNVFVESSSFNQSLTGLHASASQVLRSRKSEETLDDSRVVASLLTRCDSLFFILSSVPSHSFDSARIFARLSMVKPYVPKK